MAVDGTTRYLHIVVIILEDFREDLFGVVLFEAFVSESWVGYGQYLVSGVW